MTGLPVDLILNREFNLLLFTDNLGVEVANIISKRDPTKSKARKAKLINPVSSSVSRLQRSRPFFVSKNSGSGKLADLIISHKELNSQQSRELEREKQEMQQIERQQNREVQGDIFIPKMLKHYLDEFRNDEEKISDSTKKEQDKQKSNRDIMLKFVGKADIVGNFKRHTKRSQLKNKLLSDPQVNTFHLKGTVIEKSVTNQGSYFALKVFKIENISENYSIGELQSNIPQHSSITPIMSQITNGSRITNLKRTKTRLSTEIEERAERLLDEEELKKLHIFSYQFFKQQSNPFTKTDDNIPNEYLRNSVVINYVLRVLFATILAIVLFQGVYLKEIYIRSHNKRFAESFQVVLEYNLQSLRGLNNYFKSRILNTTEEQQHQIELLEENLVVQKNLYRIEPLRSELFYYADSMEVRKINLSLTNSSKTHISQYTLQLVTAYIQMTERLDMYVKKGVLLDFYIAENYFSTLSRISLDRLEKLAEVAKTSNRYYLGTHSIIFALEIILYLIGYFYIFRLYKLLNPCLQALIAGFNFIEDEVLKHIVRYLKIQIELFSTFQAIEEAISSESTFKTLNNEELQGLNSNLHLLDFNDMGKKRRRRVKEDNGKGTRTFRLSPIFIILILSGLVLCLFVYISDYIYMAIIMELIDISIEIKNQQINSRLASLTIVVTNSPLLL